MLRIYPIISTSLVILGITATLNSASGNSPLIPVFKEQAAQVGINHSYGDGTEFVVGGGAAVFDCNGDGLSEIFLAGGNHEASFYLNNSADGKVTFDKTNANLKIDSSLTRVTGAYPFDYDADGLVDLFVMRFGQNLLLKGKGNCIFENVTSTHLPKREDWTTAFAARADDSGKFTQLAVGNYVDRTQKLTKEDNCTESYLLDWREGTGFEATALPDSHCALSMLYIDVDGDGSLELRVANDRQYYSSKGSEQLFGFDGKHAIPLGENDGWQSLNLWGMGLTATNLPDQRLAISVTNMAENHLQVFEEASFSLENEAFKRGVASQRPYTGDDVRPSTSWHNQFADLNDDGLDDLLIIKGNVDAMPQFAHNDPDSLLLGRVDGTWQEVGKEAGIALPTKGRGAGIADFNGDGCHDLVIVNRDEPTSLFIRTNCTKSTASSSAINHPTTVGGGHAGGRW